MCLLSMSYSAAIQGRIQDFGARGGKVIGKGGEGQPPRQQGSMGERCTLPHRFATFALFKSQNIV